MGPYFHEGRWYIWNEFVEPVRAALDQDANLLLEIAYMIASGRQPDSIRLNSESILKNGVQKGKKRKRPRGLKCRVSDLQKAIDIMQSWSH